MKHLWAASLGFALALVAPSAHADQPAGLPVQMLPPVAAPAMEARPASVSAVSLGRPVALADPYAPQQQPALADAQVTRTSYTSDVLLQRPEPLVVRAQAVPSPDPVPGGGLPPFSPAGPPPYSPAGPPPYSPAGPPPVNPGMPADPNERYNCGVVTAPPPAGGSSWFGKCKELFSGCGIGAASGGRSAFQSDHCFDGFISPVTNPFLFEDPRALTEVRPIFMIQGAPDSSRPFRGSDIESFGIQARLALTDRFSIVMNKLGYVWQEVHDPDPDLQSHSGFEEVWLGPKYTFIRSEQTGTLLAGGLTFQLPIGSHNVEQDTGTLSLTPYLSFGQSFGKTSYGSFNFLNTTGYDFALDNQRTDYFFSSFHLDFDVAGLHRIYPLIEANWFHYTDNGGALPLNFEGTDLFNFGSTNVSNTNFVSMALGARYKINDKIWTGAAVEFPVTGQHELLDYRVTFDMIFRY